MNPREVAGLASTRTYPLRSSFRPSYNMAVNLVHQFGRARSRELLEQSFAQFQADQAVVGLARQLHKAEEALDGYAEAATCHQGDFMEYAALRRRISDVEKGAARERRQDRRDEAMESLAKLRPGDVIMVPVGQVLRLRRGHRPRPVRARAAALRPHPGPAGAPAGADGLPDARSRRSPGCGCPKSFNGRNPAMRRDLASALRVQDPRLHAAAAAAPRAAATPSPTRRSTGRSPSCATGSRRTPATSAPSARTTPGGPSGGSSSSRDAETLKRRGRAAHQHGRAAPSTGCATC